MNYSPQHSAVSFSRTLSQKGFTHILTDVTWNADDESLAASVAGQPRGDGDYLKIWIL
jgi:hypothetical protein